MSPTYRVKHKAYSVIQRLNFDTKACKEKRRLELNELDELKVNAYENTKVYKKRPKL